MEPDDELIKSLLNDDVDRLQFIFNNKLQKLLFHITFLNDFDTNFEFN